MSECPNGWAEAALGDLLQVRHGYAFKSDEFCEKGIPIIRQTNLTGEDVDTSKLVYLSASRSEEFERFLIRKGDVLLGMSGSIGEPTIYGLDVPALQNQRVGLLQFTLAEPALKHFCRLFLKFRQAELAKKGKGMAVQNISSSDIENLSITVPPVAEQSRIVTKVDNLFSKMKRARAELGHIPHLIERYKQAVLAAGFRGELTAEWRAARPELEEAAQLVARTPAPTQSRGGRDATGRVIDGRAALSVNIPTREPPEKWCWVSLRGIARQETGHTPSRKHQEYWGGDIPWIGIKDAARYDGGIITDTAQHVTADGLANSSARLLPRGTVCLSRTASVGYVVIMGRAMATSQDFVTWSCGSALHPEYLMYALLAEGDAIRRFGKGTTHTTIYFPESEPFTFALRHSKNSGRSCAG